MFSYTWIDGGLKKGVSSAKKQRCQSAVSKESCVPESGMAQQDASVPSMAETINGTILIWSIENW